MIKLTTPDDKSAVFYFHTEEDCDKFIKKFKNHWCNVLWNPIEEADSFPEMTDHERSRMDVDPVYRADRSLSWGWIVAKMHGRDITSVQSSFVEMMVQRLSKED